MRALILIAAALIIAASPAWAFSERDYGIEIDPNDFNSIWIINEDPINFRHMDVWVYDGGWQCDRLSIGRFVPGARIVRGQGCGNADSLTFYVRARDASGRYHDFALYDRPVWWGGQLRFDGQRWYTVYTGAV